MTAECKRVLKPSGSLWVNLGDKYAGSVGHNNNGVGSSTLGHHKGGGGPNAQKMRKVEATRRSAPDRYNQDSGGIPTKSLMGLPWRYAIGCIDHLGLILRAEVVWSKPNGLPESVTDRVRRSHEQWFMFTKEPRYFASVDEVREPQTGTSHHDRKDGLAPPGGKQGRQVESGQRGGTLGGTNPDLFNPLGKLPGSVWTIPSEPLRVPEHIGVDHFAAFPQEFPRRIILGWSPSGICVECGEGRRPVVDVDRSAVDPSRTMRVMDGYAAGTGRTNHGTSGSTLANEADKVVRTITGYACACPTPDAPTRPSVILDPFGGTGTVAMVARALGRYGVHIDLSADYLRLAQWRVFRSGHAAKTVARTNAERQLDLFGGAA